MFCLQSCYICILQIFPPSLWLIFSINFAEQKFLILMKYSLLFFFFRGLCISAATKDSLPNSESPSFSHLLCVTFRAISIVNYYYYFCSCMPSYSSSICRKDIFPHHIPIDYLQKMSQAPHFVHQCVHRSLFCSTLQDLDSCSSREVLEFGECWSLLEDLMVSTLYVAPTPLF